MIKRILYPLLGLLLLVSCRNDQDSLLNEHDQIIRRNFKMGFSTWSFGPNIADRDETYQFLDLNTDIYSEHIDYKIPWNAWINNLPLPTEFTNEINYRVSKKPANHKLLLSVSLLNLERNDLCEDYDGSTPSYSALSDTHIENAYFKHLEYLISKFNPNYLIIAIESNELLVYSESKWAEYKLLTGNIRARIKNAYPNLQLSESVTLHNWFEPNVANQADYISEISNYVNQNMDFAAISFYPFLKQQHTKAEFQQAFDFLHSEVSIPIAFSETSHIAEDLIVPSLNISINGNEIEQNIYLETLFNNAQKQNYEFVIWWAHRDYDALWETFPPEFKDIGRLWKDTGVLDEDGRERPAYTTWKKILKK